MDKKDIDHAEHTKEMLGDRQQKYRFITKPFFFSLLSFIYIRDIALVINLLAGSPENSLHIESRNALSCHAAVWYSIACNSRGTERVQKPCVCI